MLVVEQPEGLISVLLDRAAEFGDRDDAAMDLSAYPSASVENALLKVACDPSEDADLQEACGESLAELWTQGSTAPTDHLRRLEPSARAIPLAILARTRPEWFTSSAESAERT